MKDLQHPKKKSKKFKKAKPGKGKVIYTKAPPTPVKPEVTQEPPQQDVLITNDIRKILAKVFASSIASFGKIKKRFSWRYVPKKVLGVRKRTIKAFFNRYESDLQLILFPMILLVILITLHTVNSQMFVSMADQELPASRITTKLHPYPYVQAVKTPEITANAAIIVDADSQVMLYSKNPQLRFSMASTTKIMTALTGMDYYQKDSVLTVKTTGVEGSGLGLVRGDQFAFEDLLYAMLLPSANDAAQVIADNYPGGADAFIAKMNEKAASLHLNQTHYADPTGLNDDGDYTTVVDLARLASHAINNPEFVKITSTRYKTITNKSFTRQYPLTNLNRLLGTDGVTGIKTGTTEGAGEVLVTSTVKNGHTYIIVVMQSTNRFSDTEVLMNFIDEHVKYVMPQLQIKE